MVKRTAMGKQLRFFLPCFLLVQVILSLHNDVDPLCFSLCAEGFLTWKRGTSAKESHIDWDGDPQTIWSKWENECKTTVSSQKTIPETILRSLTSYVCNFELVGWDPKEQFQKWGYGSMCTRQTVFFGKILRIVRSVLSIQLCWISAGGIYGV